MNTSLQSKISINQTLETVWNSGIRWSMAQVVGDKGTMILGIFYRRPSSIEILNNLLKGIRYEYSS